MLGRYASEGAARIRRHHRAFHLPRHAPPNTRSNARRGHNRQPLRPSPNCTTPPSRQAPPCRGDGARGTMGLSEGQPVAGGWAGDGTARYVSLCDQRKTSNGCFTPVALRGTAAVWPQRVCALWVTGCPRESVGSCYTANTQTLL